MHPTIKMKSFTADAPVLGTEREVQYTTQHKGGSLVIPCSMDEALAILETLAGVRKAPETVAAKYPANDPIVIDGERAEALAGKKTNGTHAPAAPAEEAFTPKAVREKEPEPAVETKAEAKVNAPAVSDEPPTHTRKKTTTDKKPRTVADDVAEEKAAAAEPPKEPATAAKEPEAPPAPAQEEAATTSGAAGLDEAYIKSAPKLRDILGHMLEVGKLGTLDALVRECTRLKADVAILSKIPNIEERVIRTLSVMGVHVDGMPATAEA